MVPADGDGRVRVRVLVLGPVAIDADGGTGGVRGQQGHLLCLLAAACPGPVPIDALIDELWPDRAPRSARTGLRVVIGRLRERLGPAADSVVHEAGAYRLTLEPRQFDHLRFGHAVDEAGALLDADPLRAAQALTVALELWRGDAFQPFETPRLAAVAENLHRRRREAEELLLQALLDAGQAESAAAWATRFVETEPYRERRWERLMLALYRSGRQAEALQAGRRAAAVLRDDLGLEPGPGLRQLEADILAQARHLLSDRPGSGEVTIDTMLRVLRDRGGALPVIHGSFVGRRQELALLGRLVERYRLVSIVGPPGAGKTRLAAHFARGTVGQKVVWVDLAATPAHQVMPEIAGRLGIRPTEEAAATLAQALRAEPLLLVLDDCDHVTAAVAELAEALVAGCPGLSIVVTSRAPLGAASEKHVALGPLDLPAALQLLADRCPRDLATLGTPGELTALVERLDGLPLAVELVAPVLGGTTAAQSLELLAASADPAGPSGLLGRTASEPGSEPAATRRHRSVGAAVDWSLARLGPAERELFAVLGAVPGRFTAVDVAELTGRPAGPVSTSLAALARHALVEPATGADGGSGWRQLHTLRAHARAQLGAAGTLHRWEREQAERQVHLVRELGPQLAGPGEEIAVARLDRAEDQLEAAYRWFVGQGAVEPAAELALGLWEHTFFRQHYYHYHRLADTLAMPGADQLPRRDQVVAEAALAAWAMDRYTTAMALAGEAESVAAAAGRPVPLVALKTRFNVASHEGDVGTAIDLLMRMLAESQTQASPRYHADNLVVLTLGQCYLGAEAAAAEAAAQAMELARSTGNPTSIAWAQVGLATVHLMSEPTRAARSFSAAERLARTVRNEWVRGMAVAGLATALRRQGRGAQARGLLADMVGPWGRARAVSQLTRACQEAILLLADAGDRPAAARLLAQLEVADHVYPLHADDQLRLDDLTGELRRLDVAVPVADGPFELAEVIGAELRGLRR